MPITSEPVCASRSTRARPSWAGLLGLASIPLAVACADMQDPGVAYDPEVSELADAAVGEDLGAEEKAAIVISTERAEQIAKAAPKNSAGLPLWESRPGAKVALFLDFDGGRYDGQQYRGYDSDGNRSRFGSAEQTAIIRAALEVVEGYKGFNVNVTTSLDAMKKADRWGWILITDDEGTSGEAQVDHIRYSSKNCASSCYARGFAGSKAVFAPRSAERGYLLIHELGHQFGLDHSGLYVNGQFQEWSELEQSFTGDWMGGRGDGFFKDFTWIKSQTKYSEKWQDPRAIIGAIAGTVDGGGGDPGGGDPGSCHTVALNHSDYCTSSCQCNAGEGDCDDNSQCATGLICDQRTGTDICVKPSTAPSCNKSVSYRDNGGTGYGECQGDCDRDSDCQSGLRCMQLNAGDSVPGCSGRSSDNNDYCVNPICM